MLTANETWLVINKANEEDQCFHQEYPNGTLNPAWAIPLTEPDLDPSGGDLVFQELYGGCILEGLGRAVPGQKRLNMMQGFQKKGTFLIFRKDLSGQ